MAREVTLCLAGDVMTGRGVSAHLDTLTDKSAIWGAAKGVWSARAPDATIVNLETTITTSDDWWPDKRILFRMDPKHASVLSDAGLSVCSVANNHVLDCGYEGMRDTLKYAEEAGVQPVGAGENVADADAPALVELPNSRRLLVFAWAHPSSFVPPEWGATDERAGINLLEDYSFAALRRIRTQVRAVKRQGDIVVASMHWGPNWSYQVSIRRRWFARRLIDFAGVDVIHGHSSHHPIGMEFHRGRPIIYGCGDFINDYKAEGWEAYRPQIVVMYFLTMGETGVSKDLTAVPLQIEDKQLVSVDAEGVAWLCETINRGGVSARSQPSGRFEWLSRSSFGPRWMPLGASAVSVVH